MYAVSEGVYEPEDRSGAAQFRFFLEPTSKSVPSARISTTSGLKTRVGFATRPTSPSRAIARSTSKVRRDCPRKGRSGRNVNLVVSRDGGLGSVGWVDFMVRDILSTVLHAPGTRNTSNAGERGRLRLSPREMVGGC